MKMMKARIARYIKDRNERRELKKRSGCKDGDVEKGEI